MRSIMKSRKISKKMVSMALAVMMLLSISAVGMASVSAASTNTITKTVYVKTPDHESQVKCHAWNNAGATTTFPGEEMTLVDGLNHIYSYTFTNSEYDHALFTWVENSDVTNIHQTANLSLNTGDNNMYDITKGQWTKYDTTPENPTGGVSVAGETYYVESTLSDFNKAGMYAWNSQTGQQNAPFDQADMNTVQGDTSRFYYTFTESGYDKVIVKADINGRTYQTKDMDMPIQRNSGEPYTFVVTGIENNFLTGYWK